MIKLSEWLAGFLFWGYFLRLILETYMEILIAVLLNIKTILWKEPTWATIYANLFAILWLAILILVPIITLIFYLFSVDRW